MKIVMKIIVYTFIACLTIIMTACSDKQTWTVTCPWAASGTAAIVSQKVSNLSTKYSEQLILVAKAQKGDIITVNNWINSHQAADKGLILIGEGLLAITPIIDYNKLRFEASDFVFIANLYSSIFVLSAKSDLNIDNIESLKNYVKNSDHIISIAVNGATSSEAFLATALFSSMGIDSRLKLTPYASAAEAAQAVAKGEVEFAVSHQNQVVDVAQRGNVKVIAAFDDKPLKKGPFAGVRGVGEYGYPYFRNHCFVMIKAGSKFQDVESLRELYKKILADKEMQSWMQDTMLLEIEAMDSEKVNLHLQNVRNIIEKYKNIIL